MAVGSAGLVGAFLFSRELALKRGPLTIVAALRQTAELSATPELQASNAAPRSSSAVVS